MAGKLTERIGPERPNGRGSKLGTQTGTLVNGNLD